MSIEDELTSADEAMTESQEDALERADALLDEARDLHDDGCYLEAAERCDRALALAADLSTPAWTGRALMKKARAFDGLGRHYEEMAIYDAIVERFGPLAAADPEVGERVAWAIVNKAITLADLGRIDEALEEFAHAATRFPQPSDAEIGRAVARALSRRARLLADLDRSLEADADYRHLNDTFGASPVRRIRRIVARACVRWAYVLDDLGRADEADGVRRSLVERFGADDDDAMAWPVACALVDRAGDLRMAGRDVDAIAACDEMLERYGTATETDVRELLVGVLSIKSATLCGAGRTEESELLFAGAVRTYRELVAETEEGSDYGAEQAAHAGVKLARRLLDLGRPEQAQAVCEEALDLLDPHPAPGPERQADSLLRALADAVAEQADGANPVDVGSPARTLFGRRGDVPTSAGTVPGDGDVAAALVAAFADPAWRLFSAPDLPRVHDDLAARAADVYRLTAPLVAELTEEDPWREPKTQAAMLLRAFADGAAQLAKPGPVDETMRQTLPSLAKAQAGVRMIGIDAWAADRGHPLALPDATDAPGSSSNGVAVDREAEPVFGVEGAFATAFRRFAHRFEVLEAIWRSPRATALLHGPDRVEQAADAISYALAWMDWHRRDDIDAVPCALAMVIVYQSLFVIAATGDIADNWFPDRLFLRDLLEVSGGLEWLQEHVDGLPAWLVDESKDA